MKFKEYYITEAAKKKPNKVLQKFGKILFGEFRNKEDDTAYEAKIFDKLMRFIAGDYMGQQKPKALQTKFMELEKLKKYYPILRPNRTKLQRIVSDADFDGRHKYIVNQIYEYDKDFFYTKKTATYKPKSNIQSWSPNVENFRQAMGVDEFFIVEAKFPDKQLLFNTKFMNLVGKKSQGFDDDEDEILRLTNKPVKALIKIPRNNMENKSVTRYLEKKLKIPKEDRVTVDSLKFDDFLW